MADLYQPKLWPDRAGRLATVRVRHKDPDGEGVHEVARHVRSADIAKSFDAAPPRLQLAACTAEFAEILRKSYWARGSKLRVKSSCLLSVGPI